MVDSFTPGEVMMDARHDLVRTAESYEAPPPRDRLPTLPEDLSEYAWIHTGPPSWSDGDRGAASASAPVAVASALDDAGAGLLVDFWHSDVPKVVAYVESVADPSEARVLELLDGRATIGVLLETSGLALPDVLGPLSELCARGVVALDRSQRLPR
ncbi:MAG: hypothetical protein KF782_33370 [Labilithrix sp.]|nr:hypothetical protein [Labilithrix sp.]